MPDSLRDVFGDPWLKDLLTMVDDWYKRLNSKPVATALKGKSQAYGAYLRAGDALKQLASAVDTIGELRATVKAGIPYAVHTDCDGKGCKDCRNTGWLPQWRFEELNG